MMHIVDAAFQRSKVAMLALVAFTIFGISAFVSMPREADPDIPIPVALVVLPLPGVSPEDGERLLVKPTEAELQSIEGLDQMDSLAYEGAAQIRLEFEPTVDMDDVLADVREAVDRARAEYPADAEEPIVQEFNAQQLFPVISVILSGTAPERALFQSAKQLQDALIATPGVLEADLVGAREELLEVIIDPEVMEAYGLSEQEVAQAVRANNSLITAGSLRFSDGSYSVKLPGLIKTVEDAQDIPVRTDGESVVTLGDIAEIRRTFEDPDGFALFNGEPAIGMNVSKRSGANIVEVSQAVKDVTARLAQEWPETIHYAFTGDQSYFVSDILSSLTSSIILAILLVMIIVVGALGFRSAVMVGIAIPSSFLIGLALLSMNGYTLNMLVMFSMVLSVGMLVDGAIVIVEYADRRMIEGASRREAYAEAAKRMFWPIVASTGTTLAAFIPFLFWNSLDGEFMKFIPITLIFVLSASLFVALIFLPIIGASFGLPEKLKRRLGIQGKTDSEETRVDLDNVDPRTLGGMTGAYARLIAWLTDKPVLVLGYAAIIIAVCNLTFSVASPDVEYFIRNDDEQVLVIVQGRGNLSEEDKLAIAEEVRGLVEDHPAIESIYTQTGPALSRDPTAPPETIAQLNIDLYPYEERKHSREVLEDLRERTAGLPGIVLEVRQPEQGPPQGKDTQVELTASNFTLAREAAVLVRQFMEESTTVVNGHEVPTYMDIEDNQPLPGTELVAVVDREQAGRFGVSLGEIGSMIQLVTDGLLIDTYRPDDSDDEIDIRVRFPADERTVTALQNLNIQTRDGPLPISNFVQIVPQQQVDRVTRRDGNRVMDIKANGNTTVEGYEVSQDVAIEKMRAWLETGVLAEQVSPSVSWRLRGASESRNEAAGFFLTAMLSAMFMIGVILMLQFNNFYHAALTLSAVILSVYGVLLGIALSGQYISVIMTGVGIVALAGIVVNNNIVLIDTYHFLRNTGLSVEDAVIRTAAQRLRPVLLTTSTTIMGLLPMVFEINVNFTAGQIGIGSATSGWWVLLSSAIVFGLAFSTLLTLILTPVLLAAPKVFSARIKKAFGIAKRKTEKYQTRSTKPDDGDTRENRQQSPDATRTAAE
ncbi:efflux RND transporter permease subunit [Parvularcula flava]|uniref:Acriflavin resistance protein n=1 Tax=Aquisalinus luteolus TaxID=1566827 RepID=A0A8J3AA95_9PROT|nr:efflux RND transporter permease subunit [Aquisalinus luteolus]NHK29002.1 efflux RND transporter permease subunit [Aquisalinus luteolus]GGI00610.1 acriflavin resistance protein [Aquisalinus luteolus]